MRYFKRLTFWKPNGPIYLYINGESPAASDWIEIDSLLTCQLANETNGALFASEHRYYGESMPVVMKDTSSMKYLSSKQALADLAALIKTIKSAPEFKSSKVVVIGGSYAGNLAAWMRVLYPDLVDAAVSSSGPVLAKKDFYEFFETVSDVYEKYGSSDCVNTLNKMFNHCAELLKTSSGIERLKKELGICDESDMSIVENQAQYFFEVIGYYAAQSQYGNPDCIKRDCQSLQANDWARSMQKSVKFLKELSSQHSTSVVKNLFQLNKWARPKLSFKDSGCHHVDFREVVENMKVNKNNDCLYSWTYQTCTEFGYYQTTNSNKQAFSHLVPLDYYIKLCKGVFGEDFNEKRVDDGVAQTNALYGGITPNVTNVVFTHGDMDPWHRLGVLEDLSETAVVRITNGTSHCAALLSPDASDPDALTKDREYVKKIIKKWINSA
ncbi:hypothetical protein MSG28_011202 [Choristoneura fumiferana]|uniref:Uncharacterized protein n=1 Tax=Choristoneura fumiferana TaxID=7141 RepID=A0ACC0KS12_CHOFU|nr:hypothetical protein MSG28_011202 [Choristoneura fumiferana]